MARHTLIVPTLLLAGWAMVAVAVPRQQQQQTPSTPQQPPEVSFTIRGGPGTLPHFAVPDFLALTSDAETVAAAKTIGQVLWDDLQFEREFDLIPRDVYASIPPARSATDVPLDRWREVGADGVVIGTVQKTPTGMRVEMRLYDVQSRRVALCR